MEKHQSSTKHNRKKSSNKYWRERKNLTRNGAKALFGDRCHDCGYDKHWEVLEFHHLKPRHETGRPKVNQVFSWKWERCRDELLEHCVLLCPTCHKVRHLEEDEDTFASEVNL